MQSRTLIGWRAFALVLGVAAGCQSGISDLASATQAVTTPPTIDQFVLYAERGIVLGSHDLVDTGDVGISLATTSSFGPQLAVDDHVGVAGDLFAPTVSLGDHARVGRIQGTVSASAGSYDADSPFQVAAMPRLPLAPDASPGTGDIVVARGSVLELPSGSYRDLDVEGSLVLSAGTYSFVDVTVGSHATVETVDGPVVVRTGHQFLVQDHATIEPMLGTALGDHPKPTSRDHLKTGH